MKVLVASSASLIKTIRNLLSLVIVVSAPTVHADVKNHDLRQLQEKIVKEHWPACVNPRNFYDQVYCASKVYSLMDEALNKQYAAVRKSLNDAQRKQLKQVQVSWIHARDDRCASLDGDAVIMNLGCSTRQTLESLYYLRAMEQSPADFDVLLKEYRARK